MADNLFAPSENPFTLQFSFIPPQYITRQGLTNEIVNDLTKKVPTFRGHFLTGVRGCGKTVMMADISNIMNEKEEWITVDIENPNSNILDSLARGLYRIPMLKDLFIKAKLDVSVLGLGVPIEIAELIASNENDAIDFMLNILKKTNKRVLVTIDEVTYCKEIASFSHSLSSYARSGYEIYVLMTGLKENIKAIKNDKSLTFLYRAKEHILEPLNITAIIADYQKVFNMDRENAENMAWLTKGYSFAFQVLGYLYWDALSRNERSDVDFDEVISLFDQYLAEFVYEKIWSELARKEKQVLIAISESDVTEVKTIRNTLSMNSSMFSVYRNRLMDKGLINGSEYGKVKLTLPRFKEFVLIHRYEE